jgi:hypothetical protein
LSALTLALDAGCLGRGAASFQIDFQIPAGIVKLLLVVMN